MSLASPRLRSFAATSRLTLITRTAQCLRQLPSCVAVYPGDSRSCVFYLGNPFETHSRPRSLAETPRGFTFYLGVPVSSIPRSDKPVRAEGRLTLRWATVTVRALCF